MSPDISDFDVIIIGGGHAGCEAAHASARLGQRTALVTLDPKRIGVMSCNPAIGGLAKGQLVKEIDALGGIMGRITDLTAIQYKRLNSTKGPAVRSSRAQCDKNRYAEAMQRFITHLPNLEIVRAEVSGLLIERSVIRGVRLADGAEMSARAVVITSGTFLSAIMHTGDEKAVGGRIGDAAAYGLSADLKAHGFRLRRLKTGTPPRLHKNSIDWSKTQAQSGDEIPLPFSFYEVPTPFPHLPQIDCFLTATNTQTHDIISSNFHRSPMYSGEIQGVGPRYCPSIEDKVKRFSHRNSHPIFLEPEGLDGDSIYINGVSTSLPADVQTQFIRTILGCERAEFLKFGYAVEYDSVDARCLKATFQCKDVAGLFFAGQVNGTSGYEEAAAQGLVAGLNAAQYVLGRDEFRLGRKDAYIGVMVDDLVTKGSDEPYRMFTSRAEYRLLLREDNADQRLSEKGYRLGLLSEESFAKFVEKMSALESTREKLLRWTKVVGGERLSGLHLLKRPEMNAEQLFSLGFDGGDREILSQLEIETKYAGYIDRDLEMIRGFEKNDQKQIPPTIEFDQIPGLSNEVRSVLKITRPETLGQFSRIQGVTPAAVATLSLYLRNRFERKSTQPVI